MATLDLGLVVGSAGVGVPTGGTAGQMLKKNSGVDFDTAWGDWLVNGLTSADTSKALSAAQGKALQEATVKYSDVINALNNATTNKPLSAAQGKWLHENKVNYSDVQNHLGSDYTHVPLSAVMGKELKRQIDAYRATAVLLWSGSWASGAITVNGIQDWRLIVVQIGGIPVLAGILPGWGCCAMSNTEWSGYIVLFTASFAVGTNTVSFIGTNTPIATFLKAGQPIMTQPREIQGIWGVLRA